MPKICKSCGFADNPDGANCCGKCGKDLNSRNRNGSARYKVYDSDVYVSITKSRYRSLKAAEDEVNKPLWQQQVKIIKEFWKNNSAWMWYAFGMMFLAAVPFLCVRMLTSSQEQMSVIKIGDKYGIGYSDDKMLLPAQYDSISRTGNGVNLWFLYDFSAGLYGVAYVTDSEQNVIEPVYKPIYVGGDLAMLTKENRTYLAKNGILCDSVGYKSLIWPGELLLDAKVLVAQGDNGMKYLIDRDRRRLTDDYLNIRVSADSVLIASSEAKSYTRRLHTLYDYEGRKLTAGTFTGVRDFSDGVAWCTVTNQDAVLNTWTLIDNHGNTLFYKHVKQGAVRPFKEGRGWYQRPGDSRFVAIDKYGRELFDIDAYDVCPFTMGVAPVYKGTTFSNRRLGFVNDKGETVIPFKYRAKYANPTFDADSLMEVSLDGVEGKLHRNGRFVSTINTQQ